MRRSGPVELAPAYRPTGASPGWRLRPQERAGAMTRAIPPTPVDSTAEPSFLHCSSNRFQLRWPLRPQERAEDPR
eukprot:5554892-Alexandrium_andersonii.AAC.1